MATLFAQSFNKSVSTIVVNSLGGEASAALDVADIIVRNKLTVVVDTYCISACANYVFLAGKQKVVLPGAVLGFHGAPSLRSVIVYTGPETRRETSVAHAREYLSSVVSRQSAFLQSVGVQIALLDQPPRGVDLSNFSPEHNFWVYPPDVLRDRFGVSGIAYMERPTATNQFMKIVHAAFGGLNCQQLHQDPALLCTM